MRGERSDVGDAGWRADTEVVEDQVSGFVERGNVGWAQALTLPAPGAGQGGGRTAAWAEGAARGSSTGGGWSGCLRSDWCGQR